MAISQRISEIINTITYSYENIWDTCCDHGLVGYQLLNQVPESKIHFVDIVPHIIHKVENTLNTKHPEQNWQCHLQCIKSLPIDKIGDNHLIIIAGVGGDLIAEFVSSLQSKFAGLNIDFLLCGVNHNYTLRQKLNHLPLNLINEQLITDNNRFYEVIYVSNHKKPNSTINVIGHKIWQYSNEQERLIRVRYLEQLITHYKKVCYANDQFKFALSSYQSKLEEILNS